MNLRIGYRITPHRSASAKGKKTRRRPSAGTSVNLHAISCGDEAGIPWRIALVSASLTAVRAAVGAGLGITVRTAEFIQSLGGGAHEI
jgi:DNA-binding transcriptional LysR family regulator